MRTQGFTESLGRFPRSQIPVSGRFHPGETGDVEHNVESLHPGHSYFYLRADIPRAAPTEVSFGPFRLLPSQYLLLEGDKPVHVGSRALEILNVLLERPGELVTKQELMARVWPNVFVEPANLTVHISALRRALRDGRDGNRYIINVPGRGYSFVAGVTDDRRVS